MSTPQGGTSTATDIEIGKRILAALGYRGISQKAFAKEVGISYDRVRQITKGERAMNLIEYRRVVLALQMRPAELIEAAA
jgi:transcriptional regulator with XRE-family HTH domain